jgi:polysaccharide biosynthesis/export protein
MKRLLAVTVALFALLLPLSVMSAGAPGSKPPARTASAPASQSPDAANQANTVLGVGDVLKITVFQNPDMTTEARISESGTITFPLLGTVRIAGMTAAQAESAIAEGLKKGGYVVQPQVNVFLVQLRSRQVPVLGQVNKPGKYPLEESTTKLTDLLAMAGGSTGSDTVTVMKKEGNGYKKVEVDLPELFLKGDLSTDLQVGNGDIVYVQRPPVFYVYGEVARPGVYRLERKMTVMQALATAGGLTPRGTDKDIGVTRRDDSDQVQRVTTNLNDLIKQDDVIYVRQSWF